MAKYTENLPHITIYYSTNTITQTAAFNVFDSNIGGTMVISKQENITHDSNNGRFYAVQPGYYFVQYNLILEHAADGALDSFFLERNGSDTLWSASGASLFVRNEEQQYVASAITYLDVDDYVRLRLDSNGTDTLFCYEGTSAVIYKIG